MEELGVDYITNAYVEEVQKDGVLLKDGRKIECNVPIWATGAEP